MQHTLALCRRLYNAALQERIAAWQKQRVTITRYDQQRSLTQIRQFDDEYAELSVHAARFALRRVDLAYQAFFHRCKSGQKPGFPRFKAADRYHSFGLDPQNISVKDGRVHVPKTGWVKLNLYRSLRGRALSAIVKYQCGRWYVVFQQYLGDALCKTAITTTTGIDLGLTTFATLANGEQVTNPRFFKKAEERFVGRQRRLATKRRGSRGRAAAKLLVQKAHQHVRNQRLDFCRKTAKQLFSQYDLIALEDLNIKGMVEDGSFSKSIHDAGWAVFQHALACKAEEAGKHLVLVDPRGTSQRCSGCSAVVPKTLYERRHVCPRCGLNLDRDHNAALNIKALGLSVVASARSESEPCAEACGG